MTAYLEPKKEKRNITRFVCWKCKRGNVTLRKISKQDYACENDLWLGKPDIGNQSKIYE